MVGVRPVLKAWASPDELSIDTQDGVGSFSDVLRDTFLVEHVLFPITRGGELALRAVFRLAASLFAAVSAACTLLWVGSKICTDCSAGVAIGILVASAFSWAVVVSESVLQMIPRYWKTHDDNAVAIFDASNWQDMDTPEGARLEPLSEGIEVDSDCGPEPVDVPPLRLTEQQVCQRSVLPVSIAPEKGGSEALPAPACPRNLPPLPKRGGGETLQKPPSFPPPSLLRGPVAKIAGDVPSLVGPQSYPSAVSDHSALVSESCVTSTCPSISVVSSRSAISILSVSRSPPHGCDLEVIKKRYIESFKAKVTKGDQRLDCQFVRDTDTKSFSLWISGSCALLLLLVSGLIGIYSREHVSKHWPILLFEVCVGLAFTVLLDTALMTFVAVCRWRIVAHCLASRRDERWRRVAERRKLKAEAMRSVATPAITQDVPGDRKSVV